jgi:hypothetical protein
VDEKALEDELRKGADDDRVQLKLRQMEEALAEALRSRPAGPASPAAAVLRHDQAVAEVLLGYGGVRFVLKRRFGIDKEFLGTGLSRPGGDPDYETASVHEYLVPNYHDTHAAVWTWLLPVGPNFRRPIREIVAGDMQKGVERVPPTRDSKRTFEQNLTQRLLPAVRDRDMKLPPVIRFAKFPEKYYSGKLGRDDARRVFASNLAEVWDRPIQDAARLSGYTYTFGAGADEGDTFFIWVFAPTHPDEVVPATWGKVLEHLPEWLK